MHAWRPYTRNIHANLLFYLLFDLKANKDSAIRLVDGALRVRQRLRIKITTNIGLPALIRGRYLHCGCSGEREMMLAISPW